MMDARFPALLAAALFTACGAKSVDLGADARKEGTTNGGSPDEDPGATETPTAGSGPDQSRSVAPACGDGRIDTVEACDDGNSRAGDGCSASCTVEPGWVCSPGLPCGWICGDRVVSAPESCVAGTCAGHDPMPPAAAPAGAEKKPCDLYAEDGGPCVAAHSTVRALYAAYDGPLYQVKRSDGKTQDIAAATAGGFADSAAQDAFCAGTSCTISVIYDQSGWGNHLSKAPPGGAKTTPGNEADAAAASASFAGHAVYGVQILPGVAYRNNNACGTATGDEAQTVYMVVAGDFYNAGCCFDYGNVERDSQDRGEGAVEAVYFGATTIWGKGAGDGPWVMGDLENGLWAGNSSPYDGNRSLNFKYVTAMLKGDAPGKNHWTIKTGNAQTGALVSAFDGPRPSQRYTPMRKQGGISLGAAGDNSNAGRGTFFEGILTAHYSSDAADSKVQSSIVSAYGSKN